MKEITYPTLGKILLETVAKFSERESLSFVEGEKITYRKVKSKVEIISNYLINNGIKKGDRIAILSENCPNWGIVYLAITSFGGIAVPIMTEFQTDEINYILEDSGAKGIFLSEKFLAKSSEFDFDNIDFVVNLSDFISVKDRINILETKVQKKLEEIIKDVNEEDIASIIYTSGTTGHSKGVMLSNKNIISNAFSVIKLVGVTEEDKLLSLLPLSHTMECTLGLIIPMIAGASVNYLDKPPTAAVLIPALKIVKPTVILSVPLVIEKIYRQKIRTEFEEKTLLRILFRTNVGRKFLHNVAGKKLYKTFGGKLRMLCLGGAGIPEDVELFLKESNFPYTLGYGLTETSPLLTGNPPLTRRYRSSGQQIEGVQVKILNPNEKTNVGEIIAKGPNVFKGYYKNPEKTKEVFTEEGWFRTGDLGKMDADGYIYIIDRIKNVIIGSNGKNIYPEEIESKINRNKHVFESLVSEIQNKLVARVCINYESLSPGKRINEILDNIQNEINNILPNYSKLASVVEQKEPFAKTPTLKIKRYLYKGE